MSETIKNIIKLSNGNLTKQDYREIVAELLAQKTEISISALRDAEPHYSYAVGYEEWRRAKLGTAGFEATRRAALALAKINNVYI